MSKRAIYSIEIALAGLVGILLILGIDVILNKTQTKEGARQDADALAGDWYRVGNDLSQAAKKECYTFAP